MTAEKPAKPAWTRCPKCRDRVFNDPIDVEIHSHHCPADLLRELKRLTTRVEDLEKRPVVAVPEVSTALEPALDFEEIAPWSGDEPALDIEAAGPEDPEEEQEVPDVLPRAETYFEPTPPAIDRYDDDEDEEEIVTVSRPVMR